MSRCLASRRKDIYSRNISSTSMMPIFLGHMLRDKMKESTAPVFLRCLKCSWINSKGNRQLEHGVVNTTLGINSGKRLNTAGQGWLSEENKI